MDTIIFATGNKNKMIEIRMILADLGCKILSQKEAGIQADVVEDGQTFEENALIKATTIADIARKMPEYKNAVVLVKPMMDSVPQPCEPLKRLERNF